MRVGLPPVDAFWPVAMYDGQAELLIENPIARYLVNSPMLPSLEKKPDASLTLCVRKDLPGKALAASWLRP